MRTRGDRRDSDDSTASSSSSSSAFSRGGARSGYSTPATEIEEEYEQEDKFEEEEDEKPVPRGFGYSLWSRIQTAATNLSVNVGKSWETTVSLSSGEGEQDSFEINESMRNR